MMYATAATFLTGNNINAGLSQIPANFAELRAATSHSTDDLSDADYLLRQYGFLSAENPLMFSTGHGKNMNESAFHQMISFATKTMIEDGLQKLKVNKFRAQKASEYVDTFVNNILGFNDMPMEHYRKQ